MIEIYKRNDGEDTVFEKILEGYALKPDIYFHLFTSHPPCGFMAKEECQLLTWKQTFKVKPHSLGSHIARPFFLMHAHGS